MSPQRYWLSLSLHAKPHSFAAHSCSAFIHQITMRFGCRAGGLENIAFVVLQCFQPGSDIAFMLNLSVNPQIRHQERTSQLGNQLLKRIPLTAKLPFHFTVQPTFCPAPVNQLMQAGGVEIGSIGKKTTLR